VRLESSSEQNCSCNILLFILSHVLPNDGNLVSQNILLFVPFKTIYMLCLMDCKLVFISVFATDGSECSASRPGRFTPRKDLWSMGFDQRELT